MSAVTLGGIRIATIRQNALSHIRPAHDWKLISSLAANRADIRRYALPENPMLSKSIQFSHPA